MQLQQHKQSFAERNVAILVVTFETKQSAQYYMEDMKLPWPLLVDDTLALYRAYDMLKAGFWDIWGLPTWWAYAKAFKRGQRLVSSEGDPNQRGGNVIIDPDGIVRFHHVGTGPADRPPVPALLRVLEETG